MIGLLCRQCISACYQFAALDRQNNGNELATGHATSLPNNGRAIG